MVELVLDEPAKEVVGLELHLVAIEVQPLHTDPLGTHDVKAEAGDAQAALGELHLAVGARDLRVDQHLLLVAGPEVVHEEPLLHADLRGGQASTVLDVHRVEHVLAQLHQLGVDVSDLVGARVEDRVADNKDLVRGAHVHESTVLAVSGPSENNPSLGGEQYFTASPGVASRRGHVPLVIGGTAFDLTTDRGVFSAERIDPGTRVLLDVLPDLSGLPEGALVDVGCGYGPIALTLAALHPERQVVAVDVNERARELCASNARLARLAVDVHSPGGFPSDLGVAAIVSNPPIRVGKAVLHELLTFWLDRLVDGGEAWLVVHQHLGAGSLADWLGEQGWTVAKVKSKKGYRVLQVRQT